MKKHSSWLLYILVSSVLRGQCHGFVRGAWLRNMATNHPRHDDHDGDGKSTRLGSLAAHASRREVLVGGLVTGPMIWQSQAAAAAANEPYVAPPNVPLFLPESATLEPGMLESRVISNVLAPPPYGMEGPDIFYPE